MLTVLTTATRNRQGGAEVTFLATKINCDGDKCGACEKQQRRDVVVSRNRYFPQDDVYESVIRCNIFRKDTENGNRLPECLAAEKRIETVRNEALEEAAALCGQVRCRQWTPQECAWQIRDQLIRNGE